MDNQSTNRNLNKTIVQFQRGIGSRVTRDLLVYVANDLECGVKPVFVSSESISGLQGFQEPKLESFNVSGEVILNSRYVMAEIGSLRFEGYKSPTVKPTSIKAIRFFLPPGISHTNIPEEIYRFVRDFKSSVGIYFKHNFPDVARRGEGRYGGRSRTNRPYPPGSFARRG